MSDQKKNLNSRFVFDFVKPYLILSIGIGIAIIFALVGYFGFELKIKEEILPIITCIVLLTTLWVNAMAFYYNYELTQDRLNFDKDNNLKKQEKEDADIGAKEAEKEAKIARTKFMHELIEKGLKSNTTLLEQRIKLHSETLEKRMNFDKKIYTLDMISKWHSDLEIRAGTWRRFMDKYMLESKNKVGDDIYKEITRQELAAKDGEPTIKDVLKPILNYFERVSLAVNNGLADESLIRDYFEDIFLVYYHNVLVYIEKTQKQPGAASAYEQYASLCTRWKKSRKLDI